MLPTMLAAPKELNIDVPIRDVSIAYVARDDAYYLTGTTGHPDWWTTNVGVQMWCSVDDMKTWKAIGTEVIGAQRYLWSFKRDCTWQCALQPNASRRALWAPEVHFLRGHLLHSLLHRRDGHARARHGPASLCEWAG
jgi:hypothetical protein